MAVWLPLAAGTARQPGRLAAGRGVKSPTGSETILVLDDDVAVTRTVSQILQSLGYCVVEHNDADQAFAFLKSNSEDVHLIIQDLNVARYSGEQVFARIREQAPQVPIVLISGFEEPQLAEKAKDLRAAAYLQKPFSSSNVALLIRRVLDENAAPPREG
jgi:DNA-binding NtrC family response regulator